MSITSRSKQAAYKRGPTPVRTFRKYYNLSEYLRIWGVRRVTYFGEGFAPPAETFPFVDVKVAAR